MWAQSCPALCNPMDCSPPLSMGFSRQEYWSSCHFLLQGIFLTQGSNSYLLSLLHWQTDSLPLCDPSIIISCTFVNSKKKRSFPRPTSQESPEDVRNEWIQPLGEQTTVNGGRGPRSWTYECQSVWKKIQTPPTAYSVNLTSPWVHPPDFCS